MDRLYCIVIWFVQRVASRCIVLAQGFERQFTGSFACVYASHLVYMYMYMIGMYMI